MSSDKTRFLMKYGKHGEHWNLDSILDSNIERYRTTGVMRLNDWTAIANSPHLTQQHVDRAIDSIPDIQDPLGGNEFIHVTNKKGLINGRHIEHIFDTAKNGIEATRFTPWHHSDRVSEHMLGEDSYEAMKAVANNVHAARKVLDAAKKSVDSHGYGSVVHEQALKNIKAVTPEDVEVAKKSGHTMVRNQATKTEKMLKDAQ